MFNHSRFVANFYTWYVILDLKCFLNDNHLGSPICLSADSHAFLHLCHYWNAGRLIIRIFIIRGPKMLNLYKNNPFLPHIWIISINPFPFTFYLFFQNLNLKPSNIDKKKVFGNMAFEPDSEYNRHNHFQTFMAGLLVLFRWVSALEGKRHAGNIIYVSWMNDRTIYVYVCICFLTYSLFLNW